MEQTSVLTPMLTLMAFTMVVTVSIGVARNVAVMLVRIAAHLPMG